MASSQSKRAWEEFFHTETLVTEDLWREPWRVIDANDSTHDLGIPERSDGLGNTSASGEPVRRYNHRTIARKGPQGSWVGKCLHRSPWPSACSLVLGWPEDWDEACRSHSYKFILRNNLPELNPEALGSWYETRGSVPKRSAYVVQLRGCPGMRSPRIAMDNSVVVRAS